MSWRETNYELATVKFVEDIVGFLKVETVELEGVELQILISTAQTLLPRVYKVMEWRKPHQKLVVKLLVPVKWIKKSLKVLTPDDQMKEVKSLDMKDPSQENQRPSNLEALCLMSFHILVQTNEL